MRTNNKEVTARIRSYILERLDFSGYIGYEDFPAVEPETDAARVILCRDIFRAEYGYEIARRGEFNAFKEWLCGVPSALSIDFSYYDVRQIVRAWLEQSDAESAKYDNKKVWELFLHLVTREFFAMVRRAEK